MRNKKFDKQVSKLSVEKLGRKLMWKNHVINNTIEGGVIAEFGVFNGGSIGWFSKNYNDTPIYGFDSFEGLPEDWIVNNQVLFPKGHFNMDGSLPSFKGNDLLHTDKIIFIKGLFEDTLPQWVKETNDYLKILHIDSDIYSSCVTVLKETKSMFRPGTLIIFDEILHHVGEENEYKAFCEFCEDNSSFDFEVIARTEGPQAIVKVLSV